jgi:hypothetical protein
MQLTPVRRGTTEERNVMRISDANIDAVAVKYCGMGGVEDYRSFARDIMLLEREACAKACDALYESNGTTSTEPPTAGMAAAAIRARR